MRTISGKISRCWAVASRCVWATCLLACAAALLVSSAAAQAVDPSETQVQTPIPQRDPADFGLRIADGEVKPGADRRVVVNVEGATSPVVAKVHIEVGDQFVIILPDGRLESIAQRDATITDRPFKPLTQKELADQLTSGRFKGFKTRTTKNFIYVYNCSDLFYTGTQRILETMYPALYAYCKRQKIDVHPPETPLVMIMFKTRQEWEDFSGPAFEGTGVVAYYSTVSNMVVMYEQSDVSEDSVELAVKSAITTIAHEGVHQVLHNIGVQKRLSRWPMWISEGLPEYFSPTQIDANIRWKGVGLPNDLRMWSLKQSDLTGSPAATVAADDLDSDGYAWAWAVTHYLASRQQQNFFAYLKEISELEPLNELTSSESTALFQKHFGSDPLTKEEVGSHLAKLPYVDPIANLPHYVVMLETLSGTTIYRRGGLTLSRASAQQLYTQLAQGSPGAAGSQPRVLTMQNRQQAEVYLKNWLNFLIK